MYQYTGEAIECGWVVIAGRTVECLAWVQGALMHILDTQCDEETLQQVAICN